MITSNYKLTSYSDYLHQLADLLGTTFHDGKLQIPEHAGTGYFRVILFADKPETLLYNFTLRETLVLRREPDSGEHYTLVLDELERERGFQVKIGEEEPNDVIDRPKVFYLTSFLYD